MEAVYKTRKVCANFFDLEIERSLKKKVNLTFKSSLEKKVFDDAQATTNEIAPNIVGWLLAEWINGNRCFVGEKESFLGG